MQQQIHHQYLPPTDIPTARPILSVSAVNRPPFGLGFVAVQLVNARALFQCLLLVFVGIFQFLVLGTLVHRCLRLLGYEQTNSEGRYQRGLDRFSPHLKLMRVFNGIWVEFFSEKNV